MVMFALIPYLALSAALGPLTPIIGKQLHMSVQTLSLSSGLANAAYALGTVLAVQFAQHFPQRRMLLGYAALLVVGSILAAAAQDPGMYIVGRVIQGLCTSLLLIAAVPPLAIGYPANKLRDTAVIMNMCIFGAVALGPFVGGLQAQSHAWRPLFWIIAAISVVALVLAVLTFEDSPAANPDSPTRPAGDRAGRRRLRGRVLRRLGADEPPLPESRGGAAVARRLGGDRHPGRLPVPRQAAAADDSHDADQRDACGWDRGGAVRCGRFRVGHRPDGRGARRRYSPVHIGVLYLPEVAGAVITSVALGLVITKRAMHYLPLVGMIVARGRHRRLPHPCPLEPGADAPGLGPDRHRAGRHRRTGVVRRGLLAAVGQPAARVRDRRAVPCGGGVHGRADLRALRRERRQQRSTRGRASRSGSASGSQSAAR